jgi:hypothetical protein
MSPDSFVTYLPDRSRSISREPQTWSDSNSTVSGPRIGDGLGYSSSQMESSRQTTPGSTFVEASKKASRTAECTGAVPLALVTRAAHHLCTWLHEEVVRFRA